MQLIIYSVVFNQLQNWILREPVLLYVPMVPDLSSYTLLAWIMRVKLAIGSLFSHKNILVIMQGCIGISEQGLWIGQID